MNRKFILEKQAESSRREYKHRFSARRLKHRRQFTQQTGLGDGIDNYADCMRTERCARLGQTM
jgi:hypothetical protein